MKILIAAPDSAQRTDVAPSRAAFRIFGKRELLAARSFRMQDKSARASEARQRTSHAAPPKPLRRTGYQECRPSPDAYLVPRRQWPRFWKELPLRGALERQPLGVPAKVLQVVLFRRHALHERITLCAPFDFSG